MDHLSGHSSSSSIYLFLREHHRKERRKTSEKTSFGSITESLLASPNRRLVSDPTSQYTSSVSPSPLPSPHLSPLGHFMPNCSQGKRRGEGRRGGGTERRKIFSPTLLPPSAADYRGKLFMCALSSSSSSSLRSHAATKANPPKSKQAHIPSHPGWFVWVTRCCLTPKFFLSAAMAPRGVGSTTTTSAVRRVCLQITATVRSHRTCRQSLLSSPFLLLPRRERKRRNRQGLFYIIGIFLFYTRSDQGSLNPIFFGIVFTALFLQPHLANPLPSVTPNPLPPFPLIFLPSPRCPLEVMDCKASEGGSKRESAKKEEKDPSLRFLSPASAGFLLPSRDPLLLFFLGSIFSSGKESD